MIELQFFKDDIKTAIFEAYQQTGKKPSLIASFKTFDNFLVRADPANLSEQGFDPASWVTPKDFFNELDLWGCPLRVNDNVPFGKIVIKTD